LLQIAFLEADAFFLAKVMFLVHIFWKAAQVKLLVLSCWSVINDSL
jgi:hypothetical protein